MKIEQIETARAAYEIAKAMMGKSEALYAAEDLARELHMDPEQAREMLEMDERAWAKHKFWAINVHNPNL